MEQVKIFSLAGADAFPKMERQVNKWLAKNKDIEIVSRCANTVTGINILGKGYINYTMAIFYRRK
jgi:hypothetical protein